MCKAEFIYISLMIASALAQAKSRVASFECSSPTPSGHVDCRLQVAGQIETDDTLVLNNVFGSYSVTLGTAIIGDSTFFGVVTESQFLPKLFPLNAIAGATNPVLEVHCERAGRTTGIPVGLSHKTSEVFITGISEARSYLFLAVGRKLLALLALAITAVLAFPFVIGGATLTGGRRLPPIIAYSCGLLFSFSMTRVPRIFAPVLVSTDTLYFLHDHIEYLALWAFGEILISTSSLGLSYGQIRFVRSQRTIGDSVLRSLNLFGIILALSFKALSRQKTKWPSHGQAVLAQTAILIVIALLRIATLTRSEKENSQPSPPAILFAMTTITVIWLEIEATRQLFKDFGSDFYFSWALEATLSIAGILVIQTKVKEQDDLLNTHRQSFEQSLRAAHDIKSPLSALLVLSDSINQMPTQQLNLMQMAISRIQSIADEIMHKEMPAQARPHSTYPQERAELTGIISDLVNQKRLELQHLGRIKIHVLGLDEGFQRWCRGKASDLQRAISNVLNNAIEAAKGSGRVIVSVSKDGSNWEISIEDTGAGIPTEIKDCLFSRGATYGKTGGHGLGLWQAKTAIERAGGSIRLEPALPTGTRARIFLLTV